MTSTESLCQRLLDKAGDVADRGMAAESLGGCAEPAAMEALRTVLCDESAPCDVRDEAAAALGWTFRQTGIDQQILAQIPVRLRTEVLRSCASKGPSPWMRAAVVAIGLLFFAVLYHWHLLPWLSNSPTK